MINSKDNDYEKGSYGFVKKSLDGIDDLDVFDGTHRVDDAPALNASLDGIDELDVDAE